MQLKECSLCLTSECFICLENRDTAVGIRHADCMAPSIRKKLAITSPTSGGRSVGIVRSRTQTMEFFKMFYLVVCLELKK
jgi:hypothetical protein